MTRLRLQVLPTLSLLLLAALWCSPAFCQDPPEISVGATPSATYHGGDFDFVDMTTGRLNLHIPLVIDKSQRGKLNFSYSIGYTSTGAWQNTITNIGNNSYWRIEPPKYGVGGPLFTMDGALGGAQYQIYKDYLNHYNYSYWIPEGYGAGPIHQLATGVRGETIDGSGIRAAGTVGGGATNKDGISFIYSTTTGLLNIEDTNGNELLTSLNGNTGTVTDTLGRSWTTTSGSSNVTGCPAGTATPTISTIWTIPGPNGGVRTFKLCYSAINVQTNFNNGYGNYTSALPLITGVVLPDGTTWTFEYANNSYGDLAKVILPTGGYISYTWTTNSNTCFPSDAGTRAIQSRTTYDGNNSQTWTYTYARGKTTVTDPLGNDTVHSGFSCAQVPVTQIQYYSGSSISGGTLLKTVAKTFKYLTNPFPCDVTEWCGYVGPSLPLSTTTTWVNGQQTQVQLAYDSGFTFIDGNPDDSGSGPLSTVYGLVTQESHSDYYTGATVPWLSKTNTVYQALSSAPDASSYLTANILNSPSSVVTTDGSTPGNVCSETDYGYDEYSLDPSSVSKQHVAAPNAVMGNQTSVTRQFFGNPCTSSAPSETPYKTITHFYDTGMKHTVTDPNQNITIYAYSPTFYGAYVTQTTFPPTNSPNPATHVIGGNYDFNSGLLTCFTGQNSNTSSYTYDILLRVTNVSHSPSSSPCSGSQDGQTIFNYPNSTTVEMKKSIDGARWTDSYAYFDGLGREIRQASINDEPTPYDQIDTCYDADGRVGYKTYPYQGNGGPPTAPFCSQPHDTFAYDPLNRTTSVTHSDGSANSTTYANSSNQDGRAISEQDEGNGYVHVQRISQVDGLGRLTSVCEISGTVQQGPGATPVTCGLDIAGTGFLATYGYDPLGNLTSVSQGGYLPRSFSYDSLSRLVTSTNPESGAISYAYDADGNVITKTDARNITSCFGLWSGTTCNGAVGVGYDALNRLLQKTYSDGTPTLTFHYDEASALGVSLLNTTGRPSSSTVAGSQSGEVFSYDELGRVKSNSQCTPQNCGGSSPAVFPINYTYDLLGDTLTATNGMGVTLTYGAYNRALRITGLSSSLSDSSHPGTLYTPAHYNAAGSVVSASIGNSGSSVNETRAYDGRLRLCSITDGSIYSVSILSNVANNCPQGATNGYAPDSDILQAIDSANTTWSYAYDEMNRLCSANQSSTVPVCHSSGLYQYKYDRFGNMWTGDGSLNITFNLGNNNHIDNLISNYDAAGNLLYDGATNYTYDAESRIITTANNITGVTASYKYDADGRRIRKVTSNSGTVDFLYDLSGHEISQITSAGAWTRGEIYAGARHLGVYTGGTGGNTYFTFSDWLGTERARSAPGATSACETITSLPFGDGMTTNGSCGDPSPMHFTGKERDSESGLDYFGARYDSSQFGRFMTPDWSGKPQGVPYARFGDPQSLNLYSYVENNPIGTADPDGHDSCSRETGVCGGAMVTEPKTLPVAAAPTTAQNSNAAQKPSLWQQVTAYVSGVVAGAVKTYQTYTKPNSETGKTYSGRTSGTGTPQQNVAARDQGHHMNEKDYGPAKLDKSSSNSDAIRGREQQLIRANGGAQSEGGNSGNAINGVSPTNTKAPAYENAANTEFGPVDGPVGGDLLGPEGMTMPEEIPFDILF